MLNLTDKTLYRYYDDKLSGLLEHPESWGNPDDIGKDDFLFRTALGYIAYCNNDQSYNLLRGIKLCFQEKEGYIQARRCPDVIDNYTVSRDQVIMALSALKLAWNTILLNKYALGLKYRLSKRYIMTPGLWLWLRVITKEKFVGLFTLFMAVELLVAIFWHKTINKVFGYSKNYTQGELLERLITGENYSQRLYNNYKKSWKWKIHSFLKVPFYSFHLSAWMIYVMPASFGKFILLKIMKLIVPKTNLLLRMLTKQKVTLEEIEEYKQMKRWSWSSEWNGTEWFEELNEMGNAIDKDILYRLFNLNQI